jgi:hypothetical protein
MDHWMNDWMIVGWIVCSWSGDGAIVVFDGLI